MVKADLEGVPPNYKIVQVYCGGKRYVAKRRIFGIFWSSLHERPRSRMEFALLDIFDDVKERQILSDTKAAKTRFFHATENGTIYDLNTGYPMEAPKLAQFPPPPAKIG